MATSNRASLFFLFYFRVVLAKKYQEKFFNFSNAMWLKEFWFLSNDLINLFSINNGMLFIVYKILVDCFETLISKTNIKM